MAVAAASDLRISPALQTFLQDQDDDDAAAAEQPSDAAFDLDLSNLDITTTQSTLRGLEDQIRQFGDSDVLRAILDQGVDPKEYELQYETALREAEQGSVQDYIAEAENLVHLSEEIQTCDSILASMEDMLGRFQGNLGNISSEIRTLQEQSQGMSVKLRNRKVFEERLGGFLDNVAISSSLIEGILQSTVDEGYQEHLSELERKLDYLEQNESVRETAAYADVAPELERLRIKAITRVREFIMTRIYGLRKPKTNIQILQQNVLLRYRGFVLFLKRYGRESWQEVRHAYVETLSKVLSSHFKAYLANLQKLQEASGGAAELIGDTSQHALGGVMSNIFQRGTSTTRKHGLEAFTLGERAAILHHLDQAALIPNVVELENKKFPFESIFRSMHKLLMDTSTSEYLFCIEFFQDDTVYHELIAPTQAVVESALAQQLQDMHDVVGLLLVIRINYAHQLIMIKRRVPCLDTYLDRVNLLLWPRLKAELDAQLNSLKSASPSGFSEELSLHPVTQRYATLTASLLLLNSDFQNNQLESNLERLSYAAMDLLTKVSRKFKHKRSSIIFLIINYAHICQVFQETASKAAKTTPAPGSTPPPQGAPLGQGGKETMRSFEDQLTACTSMYVEDALQQHFGALIAFVHHADAIQNRMNAPGEGPIPGFGPQEALPIASDFTAKWSAAIDTLNRDVTKDFKTTSTGREVLGLALSQLLQVYTRFLDIVKLGGPSGKAVIRDAVTIPSIMYEIKKFNR